MRHPKRSVGGTWGEGGRHPVETFRWVGHRFTGGMLVPEDIVSFESGIGRCQCSTSMTIRVTNIFRRIEGEWYLVHRHADQRVRDQGTAGSGGLMFAVLLTTARNADIVEGATRAERKHRSARCQILTAALPFCAPRSPRAQVLDMQIRNRKCGVSSGPAGRKKSR